MKNTKTKTVKGVIPIAKGKGESVVKEEGKLHRNNTVAQKKSQTRGLKPPWKKGQSGNPKGKKPKTFQGVAKQLNREGYTQVTKTDVKEAYQLLLGVDRARLIKIVNDATLPQVICEVAKRMMTDGFDVIEKMLDRVHGKPQQSINGDLDVNLTLAGGLLALRKNKQRDEI